MIQTNDNRVDLFIWHLRVGISLTNQVVCLQLVQKFLQFSVCCVNFVKAINYKTKRAVCMNSPAHV